MMLTTYTKQGRRDFNVVSGACVGAPLTETVDALGVRVEPEALRGASGEEVVAERAEVDSLRTAHLPRRGHARVVERQQLLRIEVLRLLPRDRVSLNSSSSSSSSGGGSERAGGGVSTG